MLSVASLVEVADPLSKWVTAKDRDRPKKFLEVKKTRFFAFVDTVGMLFIVQTRKAAREAEASLTAPMDARQGSDAEFRTLNGR